MEDGRFSIVNGQLVLSNPYPPARRASGLDAFGRQLPLLPSKSPPYPHQVYTVNMKLSLTHTNDPVSKVVVVAIKDVIDVGWCKYSQSFLTHVDSGPKPIQGKTVFLKVFDPLFFNPDELPTEGISHQEAHCLTYSDT